MNSQEDNPENSPDTEISGPEIIGRFGFNEDETDARSSTHRVHSVSVPYEGCAAGEVTVAVFRSDDENDRGGIVLRVTLQDEGSSFLPFVKSIPSGVELHMAGDIEAESLVHALKTALATL